jgi:hypothetical protein
MEDALKFDGLDDAIIGVTNRTDRPGIVDLLVYDYEKIVQIISDDQELSRADAIDFVEFNIVGAWMGPGTPVVIHTNSAGAIDDLEGKTIH